MYLGLSKGGLGAWTPGSWERRGWGPELLGQREEGSGAWTPEFPRSVGIKGLES